MSGVAVHRCVDREGVLLVDDYGRQVRPAVVLCGNCGRAWCERCDPAGASWGCHYCHGRGSTSAPVPPRQAREVFA